MLPKKMFRSVPFLEVGETQAGVVIELTRGIVKYFGMVNVPYGTIGIT